MQEIIKSIIQSQSQKKWLDYRNNFKEYFEEKDKQFDEIINFIDSFFNAYDILPKKETILYELNGTEEFELVKYVSEVFESEEVDYIEDDANFIAFLTNLKKERYQLDLLKACSTFEAKVSGLAKKDTASIKELNDEFLMNVHTIRDKATATEREDSTLLYGEEAVTHMQDVYESIRKKKEDQGVVYYDFGLTGFEQLLFKNGDLIFFGGFTSHGKSIWLRQISYRMLTEFGRNVLFFTHEMSGDVIKHMFTCQHANNKLRFPNTPRISYHKIKHATLNDEEYDFLYNVANRDFFNNPDYGTLMVSNPNKSNFSIEDLDNKIREVETTLMPCHTVAVDYLGLIRPKAKGQIGTDDYNSMFQTFKNMALGHKNAKGESSPFLALTACQLNRDGLKEAVKAGGHYDIGAVRMYAGIEHSADILMTSLLTNEYKAVNQIRLQNLKSRDDGVVIEPKDFHIDFETGPTITPIIERSREELVSTINSLEI